MQSIILGSQSARRKLLLDLAKIPFEVVIKGIEEIYPEGMSAYEVTAHIAKQKAMVVREYLQYAYHKQHAGKTVLSADTLVVQDGEIIGKPQSRNEAISMLTRLSGKQHQVITGVAILHAKGEIVFSDVTDVNFYEVSQKEIEWYIDEYRPYDKAGAYAIQEWIGAVGIKSIAGDYYNVMGLPISRVVQALKSIS